MPYSHRLGSRSFDTALHRHYLQHADSSSPASVCCSARAAAPRLYAGIAGTYGALRIPVLPGYYVLQLACRATPRFSPFRCLLARVSMLPHISTCVLPFAFYAGCITSAWVLFSVWFNGSFCWLSVLSSFCGSSWVLVHGFWFFSCVRFLLFGS